eukprot:gene41412-56023_t
MSILCGRSEKHRPFQLMIFAPFEKSHDQYVGRGINSGWSLAAVQRWAMKIPEEFTAEAVKAASEDDLMPYVPFLKSGEPYRSLIRNNPWTRPPAAREPLEWGQGRYYDTTVGRKHPHWRDIALPQATRDLHQMRRDLVEWGYCLIEDGVSPAQCARLHDRVADQAAAERALGVAHLNI